MSRNVFDRSNPVMVIDNKSQLVSDAAVLNIMKALQTQISRDFFPAWGMRCTLVLAAHVPAQARAMKITIEDKTDDPSALGYHFNPDGWPETRVFAADDMADGRGLNGLAVTLSHEIMEMLVDPGVNLYALGPSAKPIRKKVRTVSYPYEVCDPVQGNTYGIDGIQVSDFVLPEWFEWDRKPGAMPMNFLATISAPFALDRDGYAVYRYGGAWYESWGAMRKASPGRHRQRVREAVLVAASSRILPDGTV